MNISENQRHIIAIGIFLILLSASLSFIAFGLMKNILPYAVSGGITALLNGHTLREAIKNYLSYKNEKT